MQPANGPSHCVSGLIPGGTASLIALVESGSYDHLPRGPALATALNADVGAGIGYRLRREKANPARPIPSSASVAGSGTVPIAAILKSSTPGSEKNPQVSQLWN